MVAYFASTRAHTQLSLAANDTTTIIDILAHDTFVVPDMSMAHSLHFSLRDLSILSRSDNNPRSNGRFSQAKVERVAGLIGAYEGMGEFIVLAAHYTQSVKSAG